MTDGCITAWCSRCRKPRIVNGQGLCGPCQRKAADEKRWTAALAWDRPLGGVIYGGPFLPDVDNEDAPLCTRCKDLNKCGVVAVDDDHLLSGCDLWEPRRTREEKRQEEKELVKDFPHDEYEEDIGNCIAQSKKRLETKKNDKRGKNEKL